MLDFKKYTTSSGEILLYTGDPNLARLDVLAEGPGDLWHSGLDQGLKNIFSEVVYQTAVFFFFTSDFDQVDSGISWRINPNAFIIRERVWGQSKGFDKGYTSELSAALAFGFNTLRYGGLVPLYVKGLFAASKDRSKINTQDRYQFYRRSFKLEHTVYMFFRRDVFNLKALNQLLFTLKNGVDIRDVNPIVPRELKALNGVPTVSYIIPTMYRVEYTLQLLSDLNKQTLLPKEVIVIDATPLEPSEKLPYTPANYKFNLIAKTQVSKGSCNARNEAIDLCSGDYLIFGDDDIRIPPNFIENHIRFLQTNNADACNGLDIRAEHHTNDLTHLTERLVELESKPKKAGVAMSFSNANSCVKRSLVHQLNGNDTNFDGGYGEDSDFGFRLLKHGVVVLNNPYAANLHLKPPSGGYRFWGSQAALLGRKRKRQPWELGHPVGFIRPVPSPTIMYGLYKNNDSRQRKEYKIKYFLRYLFSGAKVFFLFRLINFPFRLLQYQKSVFYAKLLLNNKLRGN